MSQFSGLHCYFSPGMPCAQCRDDAALWLLCRSDRSVAWRAQAQAVLTPQLLHVLTVSDSLLSSKLLSKEEDVARIAHETFCNADLSVLYRAQAQAVLTPQLLHVLTVSRHPAVVQAAL